MEREERADAGSIGIFLRDAKEAGLLDAITRASDTGRTMTAAPFPLP
jgi:hypothetical protein